MRLAIPVSILILFLLAACKTQRECIEPYLVYNFEGFDSSELALVQVTEFEKGTHFSRVVSTRFGSSSIVKFKGDTTPISNSQLQANRGYDEIIRLPYAGGKEFKIRDISFGSETQTEDRFSAIDDQCALSCWLYLDDSLVSFSKWAPTEFAKTNYIDLKKK